MISASVAVELKEATDVVSQLLAYRRMGGLNRQRTAVDAPGLQRTHCGVSLLPGDSRVAAGPVDNQFEALQARLNEFGEDGLVDIASDATRMQMRRMMERLIAEEQRPHLAAD